MATSNELRTQAQELEDQILDMREKLAAIRLAQERESQSECSPHTLICPGGFRPYKRQNPANADLGYLAGWRIWRCKTCSLSVEERGGIYKGEGVAKFHPEYEWMDPRPE